jgi:6-phosphogluconate dehydrogenase
MNIAVIGLGKMGEAIAWRALQAGHMVYGYDTNTAPEFVESIKKQGIIYVRQLSDYREYAIDLFWIMVPQGHIVDSVLNEICIYACKGSLFLDGGNSHFTDSIRRAHYLEQQGFSFLDCGTSGGVHGRKNGFCLMVGGDRKAYEKVESLLTAVAAHNGCLYTGPSGTGHYVKMIHNGIEYGMLQAYAEGFHLLKDGSFKDAQLDLEAIAMVWNHGSVVRSWILELVQNVMHNDPEMDSVVGSVAATGMGAWTVEEAHKTTIPVPVIEKSLDVRTWSQETGGNYATKVVAMLRNQFGGHAFVTKKD